MEANSARRFSGIKMAADRVLHLILEFPQVSALRCNSAAFRCIPTRYQPPGFLVVLDAQRDFLHAFSLRPEAGVSQAAARAGGVM